MIASIIPAIRTPRHIEAFDYQIPEGSTMGPGDLVEIPFRSRTIIGMIDSCKKQTDFPNIKTIQASYHGIQLNPDTQTLLHRLASRSFCSPATILHAWLGNLPKKNEHSIINKNAKKTQALNTYYYGCDTLHALINEAKQQIAKNNSVLIISPLTQKANFIAKELETTALTSELAAGKRFTLWKNFIQRKTPILVTTRIGSWCATEADIILLDEPENDEHKQDESTPRYDARWIVALAQSKGTGLIRYGLTPSVNALYTEPLLASHIPEIQTLITYVDIHKSDWSTVPGLQERTLLQIQNVNDDHSVYIIHPIHGDRTKLRCADCLYTATCSYCGSYPMLIDGQLICKRCNKKQPTLATCPECGGTRLEHAKPGRNLLKKQLQLEKQTNINVLSIGEWQKEHAIPPHSLIVLTDLTLLSGVSEDLRKKERLIITWRKLCAQVKNLRGELVVQGSAELLSRAKEWLTPEGCEKALKEESDQRIAFELPPATRLIKLIFLGDQSKAEAHFRALQESLRQEPNLRIEGLFPVLNRPKNRTPRWIGHIYMKKNSSTEAIINALIPIYQTNTIIDLDPIAFFE